MTNISKTLRNLSAKEKANELIKTFSLPLILTHNESKIFALKTVDEIFYELNSIEYTSEVAIKISYWQEIKQEIENL